MRLTTWNCFRGKAPEHCLELLEPLRAVLITLQECRRPDGEDTPVIWRGTEPAYGTAVVSTLAAVQLESISIPSLHPPVVPVVVHAPQPFVFVGVWTHPPYNEVAWDAMSACVAAADGLPVVGAGDFNSSPSVSVQERDSLQFLERMRNGNHSVWGWTAGGEDNKSALMGGAARSGAVLARGSAAGGMLGLPRWFDSAGALGRAVT